MQAGTSLESHLQQPPPDSFLEPTGAGVRDTSPQIKVGPPRELGGQVVVLKHVANLSASSYPEGVCPLPLKMTLSMAKPP